MKMTNKYMEGDNIVEKMMEVENRKQPPKNRKVGNDLNDGEREREERREE